MKILWIVDNKFRELYGLYNLKNNLSKHNIKLFLFDIPIWKSAIDFINPNIIVVPNLYHSSCEPIVKYAYKKKIYVFMHSSEGMFYNNKIQNDKYPKHLIKKLEKILSWGKMDSEYLIKKGYKKKLVETGCLKFDEKNYLNIEKKTINKKIKTIGIPTHMRLITGSGISRFNIPYGIRKTIKQEKNSHRLGYLKFEYEYIELLCNIIDKLDDNYKIIIKVSPFEDPMIYKKTFPNQEIHLNDDVRVFLKKVDVILNLYSSISIDSIKFNVPVINLKKLVTWNKYILSNRNGPNPNSSQLDAVQLGIVAKSYNDLYRILKKKKSYLVKLSKDNKFSEKANKLAQTSSNVNIMTNLFLSYKEKTKYKPYNYLMFIKYILVEIKLIFYGRPRAANYKMWKFKDQKLLFDLRIL